jgi:hypothetical protein
MMQNRLLALNYVDEGIDDKLYEAHRYQHYICFIGIFSLCERFHLFLYKTWEVSAMFSLFLSKFADYPSIHSERGKAQRRIGGVIFWNL